MTNCWLCISKEHNWEIAVKQRIWGASKQGHKGLFLVRKGDLMVFYVKPRRIGGIFQADSEPFKSNEAIFSATDSVRKEIFPYRIRMKPVAIPRELIDFCPLIPKLSFTSKHIGNWGIFMQGRAIIPLLKKDYNCIEREIRKKMADTKQNSEAE